jgi:hypothetical protein
LRKESNVVQPSWLRQAEGQRQGTARAMFGYLRLMRRFREKVSNRARATPGATRILCFRVRMSLKRNDLLLFSLSQRKADRLLTLASPDLITPKKFSPPRPNGREGLMFPPEQSSKYV